MNQQNNSEDKVSAEFTCKCGKQKGWITDGEEHPNPCPLCGKRYRGEYNPKTLQIDAIEVIYVPKSNGESFEEVLKKQTTAVFGQPLQGHSYYHDIFLKDVLEAHKKAIEEAERQAYKQGWDSAGGEILAYKEQDDELKARKS